MAMSVEAWICGFLWSVSFGVMLFGTAVSLFHLRRREGRREEGSDEIGISVLKPLKGIEPGLRENLETFFQQNYSNYELIFSVADADDIVLPLIRELIGRYPNVQSRLIVGDVKIGHNPKINNIVQSYEGARYDWIVIGDANVRVSPDYLKTVSGYFSETLGVTSGVVAGVEPQGLGGWVEAAFLNTFLARGTVAAFYVGRPIVIGKTMAFRRSVANRFGGVRFLAQYLAEDYMTGEMMARLGMQVILMKEPVRQFVGRSSLKSFWLRHLRWGRLRRAHAPIAFVLEPFGSAFVAGLLGAYACLQLTTFPLMMFLFLHGAVWMLCDCALMKRLLGRVTPQALLGWLLREMLAFPLWFHTSLGSTVMWHGHRLKLRMGGTLESST